MSTAFINAGLESDVYMRVPEGVRVDEDSLKTFVDPDDLSSNPKFVLKLKRNLYGLRQAPLNWHKTLID